MVANLAEMSGEQLLLLGILEGDRMAEAISEELDRRALLFAARKRRARRPTERMRLTEAAVSVA